MANGRRRTQARQKTRRMIIQFIEYLVGGGVWFWSGYVIIVFTSDYWQPFGNPAKDIFIGNLLGNAVGITLNYLIQYYWVFRTKRPKTIAFTAKRYIVYTVLNAFILNYLLLYYMKEWFGIDPKISQFIASGFFTVWNYIWYKIWVFPEPEHPTRVYAKPRARKVVRHVTSQH